MKFQGLLLAFIILVSIFVTSLHNHLLAPERKSSSQFSVVAVKSQEPQKGNLPTAAVLEVTSGGDDVTVSDKVF